MGAIQIMSHTCNECNELNVQCTCDMYEQPEPQLMRCDRCETFECRCGDSDFEDAYERSISDTCEECGWNTKMTKAYSLRCVCITLPQYISAPYSPKSPSKTATD
jgi:hypothetical protein